MSHDFRSMSSISVRCSSRLSAGSSCDLSGVFFCGEAHKFSGIVFSRTSLSRRVYLKNRFGRWYLSLSSLNWRCSYFDEQNDARCPVLERGRSFISRPWFSRFGSERSRAWSRFVPERGWHAGAGRATGDTVDNNTGNCRALCSRDEAAGSTFVREVGQNHEEAIPSNAPPDVPERALPRAWRFQNSRGRPVPAVGAAWFCIWNQERRSREIAIRRCETQPRNKDEL